MENLLLNLETEAHSFMETVLKSIVHEVSGVFRNRTDDSDKPIEDKLRRISQVLARRVVIKITSVEHDFGTEVAQTKQEDELRCLIEVLLKSIVYEVSEVFQNGVSDSEDGFQDKLRGVAQILVRRAVVKITQCVEDSFGSEMAQMKQENERLKVRLQFWEKEPGAGGDRGQTDRVGHTPPREVAAEIKEETELSGSEVSALPDAGDRAPLEQQPSEEEEEWGSRLMQETELAAAQGKETLSEQQHPESRQRVEDLDSVPVMKTEPERETPGLFVCADFTEKMNNLDTNNITQGCNELGRVSVQEHKEELGEFNLTEQDMEPQLTDPAEQQTAVPGEENSTESQHPEESKDREEQQQHLQRMVIIRPCSVQVERLSLQSLKHSYDPLVSDDFTRRFNNLVTEKSVERLNVLGSVSVLGHREEQLNDLDGFSLGELEREPQLIHTAEQQTAVPGEGNSTESRHPEESQDREEQEQHLQRMMIIRPCSVQVERLSLQSLKGEEGWGSSLMQQTELTGAQGKETLGEQHTESRQRQTVPAMNMEPERETPGPLITGDFAGQFINVSAKENAERFNDLDSVSPRGPQENELAVSNAVDERPRTTPTGRHEGENAGPFGGTGQDRHGERSQSEKPQRGPRSQGGDPRPGSEGVDKNSSQQIPGLCPSNCSKQHQHLHAGKRPFVCGQCGASFIYPIDLKTHQLMHSRENQFSSRPLHTCSRCEKSFSTPNLLRSHQRVHTGERPFGCDECGTSFICSSDLKAHQLEHSGGRAFSSGQSLTPSNGSATRPPAPPRKRHACDQCEKSFAIPSRLKAHQRFHMGERPFGCGQCGKAFCSERDLKSHQRVHMSRRFTCSECGKAFLDLRGLRLHERVHTGERPFGCGECGTSFICSSDLKAHQLEHSGGRAFSSGQSFTPSNGSATRPPAPPRKRHSCDQCEKSFALPSRLKAHQRFHTGERPFGCGQCGKAFCSETDLKSHQRVHTRRRFMCSECGKAFLELRGLRLHERVHTGERPFGCGECGKTFAFPGSLKYHELRHAGERRFGCATCGRRFFSATHLKSHRLRHTGEKPFSCNLCGKAFTRSSHVRAHQRLHAGERRFVCGQCGKRLRSEKGLRGHERLHAVERRFVCSHCGKLLGSAGALRRHEQRHAGGGEPFRCSQCGKSFSTAGGLRTHRRAHTGERPFACGLCEKRFFTSSHLKEHQVRHTGEKPFACGLCDRRFTRRACANKHRRLHARDTFACRLCQKLFSTAGRLKTHLGLHTGGKPYICDQCGKGFGQAAYLKAHQSVHTGLKPFSCGQCGRAFARSSHRKSHEATHTGEKPYGCGQCGKSFRRPADLRRHQGSLRHKKRARLASGGSPAT